MRVPCPGWLSMVIRCPFPNSTFSLSLTLLTPMPCSRSVPVWIRGCPRHRLPPTTAAVNPAPAAQPDGAAFHFAAQAVLNAVFDQRLQQHAGHQHIQRVVGDLLFEAQLVPEAHHLDGQIIVDEAHLVAQRVKLSCLRSSRRRILESFSTMTRAWLGSVRINEETEFSVLKRKCGLIWLVRASRRASIRCRCCSSSFSSLRVLFQILIGIVTAKMVVA